jgi:hypothetical protein
LLTDFTSSMAELSGELPSVLMATWARDVRQNNRHDISKEVFITFFIRGT